MKMCDSHDRCQFGFQHEKHTKRKSMNDRAPKRPRDDGELLRCLFDPGEGGAE